MRIIAQRFEISRYKIIILIWLFLIYGQVNLIQILVTTGIHWRNLSITRLDTLSGDLADTKKIYCFFLTTKFLVIWWATTTFTFLSLYVSDIVDLLTVPHYQQGRYLGRICANINASYWIMFTHMNPCWREIPTCQFFMQSLHNKEPWSLNYFLPSVWMLQRRVSSPSSHQ